MVIMIISQLHFYPLVYMFLDCFCLYKGNVHIYTKYGTE